MPDSHHRQVVWEALLDADFRTRYFGNLAGRLQRRERLMTIGVTVLSSSAFLALITKVGIDFLPQIFSALAAVMGAVLAVYKLGKSASLSASLCARWLAIRNRQEALWAEIDDLQPQEVLRRWESIAAETYKDAEVAAAEFPLHKRLANEAQGEVMRSRRLAEAA